MEKAKSAEGAKKLKITHILDNDDRLDEAGVFKLSDKNREIGYLIWDCEDGHIELCDLLLHDKEDRGQGYGSALVSALFDHAEKINANSIHGITQADDEPVHRFYVRHGFSFVTPKKFTRNHPFHT